ncbi:hypothetical protein DN403_27640 [Bacillus sp. AY2-1]|nr:hypothetical protein DN403_27640 [Bacillus sp. AY2-1]
MILITKWDTSIIKKRKNVINCNIYIFKSIDKMPTKKGGILIMKSTVLLMYKPFENRISKRISTPISEVSR